MIIPKLLVVLSGLIILGAGLARWWFWSRQRTKGQRKECSITVEQLYERMGLQKKKAGDYRDAAALGNALRDGGLWLLEKDGIKIAKRRRTGWWNLKILPFLVVIIYVFAIFVAKTAAPWVLGIGAAAVAFHVINRISTLRVELEAVKRGWAQLEKKGGLHRMDEIEQVLECARASAWNTILPW